MKAELELEFYLTLVNELIVVKHTDTQANK